jgi:hypothetical protein
MPYDSVDALQRALTRDVFHYAKDAKKAAGRSLGTLVEIITFYLIKTWHFEKHIAIERRLPEYANPDITHNVEFTLHPSMPLHTIRLPNTSLPITSRKITNEIDEQEWTSHVKSVQLLSSDRLLRNACTLFEDESQLIVVYLRTVAPKYFTISIRELNPHPFAVFECKRVGVEEGVKKGPQTIEKAKQGAYVARTVSSLQKIRMADGTINGILELKSGKLRCEPYNKFLQLLIQSNDADMLRHFTLTVGVVSNHGNWFTSNDHNKELKVLAQSYDWLLFLSDQGLSEFVQSLLVSPSKKYKPIKTAFKKSYTGQRGINRFTKVQIDLAADLLLQDYFTKNLSAVKQWFNVISPAGRSIPELKQELSNLASKKWNEILK